MLAFFYDWENFMRDGSQLQSCLIQVRGGEGGEKLGPPPLSYATGQIHNELQFYIPVISLDMEFSKDSQLFNTNIPSKGGSMEGVVNILLSRVGTPQKTAPPFRFFSYRTLSVFTIMLCIEVCLLDYYVLLMCW